MTSTLTAGSHRGGTPISAEAWEQEAEAVARDGEQIVSTAHDRGIELRLLGGVGIFIHCQGATHNQPVRTAAWRRFADLDFIGRHSDVTGIKQVFAESGYVSDAQLNTLHGRYRLVFDHPITNAKVDVLLDVFRMCHELPLVGRLAVDNPTLSLADLLLTKLQIIQLNRKDLDDVAFLLHLHEIGETDLESINARYIGGLCAKDWGLYRTVTGNLNRLLQEEGFPSGTSPEKVIDRARELQNAIEAVPKSLKWTLRSKVGDRYPWYEEVEEVER